MNTRSDGESNESGPAYVLDDGTIDKLILSYHLNQMHPLLAQVFEAFDNVNWLK